VVNDGSTDDTLAVLKENFDLAPVNPLHKKQLETKPVKAMYRSRGHPILVVVDKENGGKADSLNAGLSLASGELICAIDADTPIEPDGLQLMVRPFLAEDDVIAAGRTIRVVNGAQVKDGRVVRSRAPRKPLPGFQVVEYLRAFLFGRVGRNRLGGNLVISGAFALFLRERMIEAGGYESDSVGEGMELIMRLRRRGHEGNDPEVSNLFPIRWRGPRCPSP
jgi:cellulose synthase/poly-beta-1,6-N-acetylglucosamine synthase-like glycosyltransferase